MSLLVPSSRIPRPLISMVRFPCHRRPGVVRFYVTLPATLLVAFSPMLKKRRLSRRSQSEALGPIAGRDMARKRESRPANSTSSWCFHLGPQTYIGPLRIRALQVPVGEKPFGFSGRRWPCVFWVLFLPVHYDRVRILLRLSISRAILAPDSLRNQPG